MFKKLKPIMPSVAFLLVLLLLSATLFVAPKKGYSENEKRILAQAPQFTLERLADGKFTKDLESFVSDQFPLRDFFVGVNSYFNLISGRNSTAPVYYGKDGYLIGAPADLSIDTALKNVQRFSEFAEKNKLSATIMVVPQCGYVMADKLPSLHGEYTDDKIFEVISENKGNMTFVDVRDTFNKAKNDVQLYYKTDHHITSAGAYELYKLYAAEKGLSVTNAYEIKTEPDFYGTSYSKSGYWLSKPDVLEMWYNKDLKVTVEITEPGKDVVKNDSVFFTDRLEESDKYPVYLDGNHSLTKITNPNAKGGKLLIIKDSFAHCFTAFLAEQYSEIYMVDMRYYRTSVSDLVAENGISEVLYLYGTESIGTDTNSSWLS
ncbi:MAG: hypothetical protein J6Q83_03405 [Clostridia bacterium]|nr:hypothetical protein [Clostridia bacterium]